MKSTVEAESKALEIMAWEPETVSCTGRAWNPWPLRGPCSSAARQRRVWVNEGE